METLGISVFHDNWIQLAGRPLGRLDRKPGQTVLSTCSVITFSSLLINWTLTVRPPWSVYVLRVKLALPSLSWWMETGRAKPILLTLFLISDAIWHTILVNEILGNFWERFSCSLHRTKGSVISYFCLWILSAAYNIHNYGNCLGYMSGTSLRRYSEDGRMENGKKKRLAPDDLRDAKSTNLKTATS